MTSMFLESQCIKIVSRDAYVHEIHRWLLEFPEMSRVKPCAPLKALVPLSCFKKFENNLAKSYTKEDDDVLWEILRNQDAWVDMTQADSKCFHFRILADQSKEKQSSIFSTC